MFNYRAVNKGGRCMMISTRARYALRCLIDLAEHNSDGYTPLKELAARQGLSKKYTECIMVRLSKHGIIEGVQGKNGGYKLTRSPKDYTIFEILSITETTLASVACLKSGAPDCPRKNVCRTIKLWQGLDKLVSDYFKGITLFDLMDK